MKIFFNYNTLNQHKQRSLFFKSNKEDVGRRIIATSLTLFRVGTIPILVLILHLPGKVWSLLAVIIFFIAGITDFLDGWLARRMKSVSRIGQYLDPLADKLLISSMLIMLTVMNRIPAWMTIFIVCREIAITGMRALAASYNFQIPIHFFGKCKTAFQILVVLLLLFPYPLVGFDFQRWGQWGMWLVFIITMWSGIDYVIRFWRLLVYKS